MDYSYQTRLVDQATLALEQSRRAVFAAGCGAGKTRMAGEVIQRHLAAHPGTKVLVLAHGLTELRSQMHSALRQLGIGVLEVVPGVSRSRMDAAQVHCALPHSLRRRQLREDEYSLIVVDEAHHFYHGDMVQGILRTNPGARQLLLTASHGGFNRDGWPLVCISQLELLDAGVIMDPVIEMAVCPIDFRHALNSEGNLPPTYQFERPAFQAALDAVLAGLHARLTSSYRADSEAYASGGGQDLRRLGKTLVACHSQETAQEVAAFFERAGADVALSSSDFDPDSEQVRRFKEDAECSILVVVNRGVLGFNMPELETVVDLTGSDNVDRIYQLLGRCLRVHEGKKPLFLKLVPEEHTDWYAFILNAVMWLAEPTNYREYRGDPRRDIRMLVGEEHDPDVQIRRNRGGGNGKPCKPAGESGAKLRIYGFAEIRDVMQRLRASSTGAVEGHAWTNLRLVAAQYSVKVPDGYWTVEKCREEAATFSSLKEWALRGNASYKAAKKHGMRQFHDLFPGRRNGSRGSPYWTVDRCREEAAKHASITAWVQGNRASYMAARKHGMQLFHDLFPNRQAVWTEEALLAEAAKYRSLSAWAREGKGSYGAAYKRGLQRDLFQRSRSR